MDLNGLVELPQDSLPRAYAFTTAAFTFHHGALAQYVGVPSCSKTKAVRGKECYIGGAQAEQAIAEGSQMFSDLAWEGSAFSSKPWAAECVESACCSKFSII